MHLGIVVPGCPQDLYHFARRLGFSWPPMHNSDNGLIVVFSPCQRLSGEQDAAIESTIFGMQIGKTFRNHHTTYIGRAAALQYLHHLPRASTSRLEREKSHAHSVSRQRMLRIISIRNDNLRAPIVGHHHAIITARLEDALQHFDAHLVAVTPNLHLCKHTLLYQRLQRTHHKLLLRHGGKAQTCGYGLVVYHLARVASKIIYDAIHNLMTRETLIPCKPFSTRLARYCFAPSGCRCRFC